MTQAQIKNLARTIVAMRTQPATPKAPPVHVSRSRVYRSDLPREMTGYLSCEATRDLRSSFHHAE